MSYETDHWYKGLRYLKLTSSVVMSLSSPKAQHIWSSIDWSSGGYNWAGQRSCRHAACDIMHNHILLTAVAKSPCRVTCWVFTRTPLLSASHSASAFTALIQYLYIVRGSHAPRSTFLSSWRPSGLSNRRDRSKPSDQPLLL